MSGSHGPRPAAPNPSAFAVLTRTVDPRLRAEASATFAGLARASDGALEIYVAGADSQPVASILRESQIATGTQQLTVRVIAGKQHSLHDLEALRDQITTAQPALKARGIALTEWAVDLRANRVRIGVLDLDATKAAALGQQFGADRISVIAGAYYAPSDLSQGV